MNAQHQHIVKSHDDEQTALRDTLIQMGQLATNQLESALDAVARRDEAAAREVIANDEHIDAMEQHINHDAVSYTHLDVYKRQIHWCSKSRLIGRRTSSKQCSLATLTAGLRARHV